MGRGWLYGCVGGLLLAQPCGLAAPNEADAGAAPPSVEVRTSVKWALWAARPASDPLLGAEEEWAASFWRVRFDLNTPLSPRASAALAYEHSLQWYSGGARSVGVFGVAARNPSPPFRVAELRWPMARTGLRFLYAHEIDRAYVTWRFGHGEASVGRQAVGWGRGVLFNAVDFFAPFSPLEPDREWRRGVDAVRAEWRLSPAWSVEGVAAFGESLAESAALARARGYRGRLDAEVMLGKRARDVLVAATASAALGEGEVHGEVAQFRVPAGGGTVGKLVLGGSYTLGVARGVTLLGEYHYCGFGAGDAAQAAALLQTPAFRERYLRGDMQVLGREALAVQATSPVGDDAAAALLWLHAPGDGSGVLSPSLSWPLTDHLTLAADLYLSYGRGPRGGAPRSEYGSGGASAFAQARMDF
ncbi:MAG: hypothetical protein QHJ73_13450 [Armatimonadota bacterium]|nr:hypothetical protein [Armatimonadota bacterium]